MQFTVNIYTVDLPVDLRWTTTNKARAKGLHGAALENYLINWSCDVGEGLEMAWLFESKRVYEHLKRKKSISTDMNIHKTRQKIFAYRSLPFLYKIELDSDHEVWTRVLTICRHTPYHYSIEPSAGWHVLSFIIVFLENIWFGLTTVQNAVRLFAKMKQKHPTACWNCAL